MLNLYSSLPSPSIKLKLESYLAYLIINEIKCDKSGSIFNFSSKNKLISNSCCDISFNTDIFTILLPFLNAHPKLPLPTILLFIIFFPPPPLILLTDVFFV